MADKKISALTAATTPLAGSEVLPVVQGGNTVKVSVADLTNGRDVTAKDVYTTGNLGVKTSTPSRTLFVSGPTGGAPSATGNVTTGEIAAFYSASTQVTVIGATNSAPFGTFIQVKRTDGTSTVYPLLLNPAGGSVSVGSTAPNYRLDVNGSFGFTPGASVTPVDNGDVVFELTDNTTLTVKAKGSDGVVRTVALTLA